MRWLIAVVAGVAGVAGCGLVGVPMLMVTAIGAGGGQTPGCLPGLADTPAGATTVLAGEDAQAAGLTATQLGHAATIVTVGEQLGLPRQALVVALATAAQESRFLNYANDGQGGDLAPEQRDVARSLQLPHDAVGTDHGSVGVFQQQYPWWGSLAELMDPATSAALFYRALLDVPGWQQLPVTVAAQRVQRSAFPTAYADDEPLAQQLVSMLATGSTPAGPPIVSAGLAAGSVWCGLGAADLQMVTAGDLVLPLPAGTYQVTSAFGWRANPTGAGSEHHTGLDFGAPAGTPVLALTGGVVEAAGPSGSGYGTRVVLRHSATMQTLYAHLSTVTVQAGQAVTPGQQIGTVGSTGRSTAAHLHLEVRLDGAPVDPDTFLRQAGLDPRDPPAAAARTGGVGGAVSMVTYNVHYGRDPSRVAAEIASVIGATSPDVICLQEATVAARVRLPAGWRLVQPTVPGRGGGLVPSATPLLVNTRHWAVTRTTMVPLTGYTPVGPVGPGPSTASRRDLVLAWLAGPRGSWSVGCTHFTAGKHLTGTRAQLWRTQAARVAATVGRLPTPALIGADWNAEPTSTWMAPLRQVAVVNSHTGPTLGGARIDHVWGAGAIPAGARVLPGTGSDHRPVLTLWRATGSPA